ncbi:MAG: TonB-dependent receptor [Bacteroidaceae bacterium]|nr:TonB-dependent receptor [Bacteroidaceae bacterium]
MKKMKLWVMAATLAICGAVNMQAETLRGTVKDAITGEPLTGATVKIVELSGVGAVADIDGNYLISVSQGGRYTIEANYIGYEPSVMKEILISGAKEVVLDITLRENNTELTEVVVRPRVNKEATVNPTVLTGGVMLSMEEASRFAGGANDPARLVMSFAGVSGEADGSGLSVHGNAPERMQYRIEGVEVFTPNHYNDMWNAGYGLVSGLNSNVIGNSDFFTSTFNANYSNALSGVFDVKMRPGNNAKYENILQVGSVFEELTLEGPISKKNYASYIVNYRYGFSSLVDKMGLIDTEGDHITFQDLSWKLNLPTKRAGTFSVFGLALFDKTHTDRVKLKDMHSAYDASNNDGDMMQILAGVSHKIHLGNKWTWRTTAAYNMQHISMDNLYYGLQRDANGVLTTPLAFEEPEKQYLFSKQKQNEDRLLFNTELSKQVSGKWLTQFGAEYSHRFFDLNYRSVDRLYADPSTMQTFTNMKDNTGLASAFWQNLLTLSDHISMSLGVAANYFVLSKDFSAEPRFSIKWQPDDKNSISFGYGLHSMVEKLDAYFYRDAAGNLVNKDLGLTKAHHLLANYMYKINDNMNIRLNLFYQYGFDTPVGTNGSTYCVCNRFYAYTNEPLVGKGNTRNYGGDITLEHYMSHGFFGQTNFSLYKSEYRGEDKVWRNQFYDRGFMFKILGGKEWILGKNVLNVSAKYSIQGGLRYTPIDVDQMSANLDAGIIDDTPIYKDNEAFSKRFKPTSVVDLTVSYKINKRKVSHTIAFEGLNILGSKAPLWQRFDLGTRDVRTDKAGISLPNIFYRLDF